MTQRHWSQELAFIGPGSQAANPLLVNQLPWRTCDIPPTIAAALDEAPSVSDDAPDDAAA